MQKKMKKTILAVVAMLAVMLWMDRPVNALGEPELHPMMVMGSDVLSKSANDPDNVYKVVFATENDSREWNVIGYDGKGNEEIAKNGKGVITLFQGTVFENENIPFNAGDKTSNIYKGSLLEQTLNNWMGTDEELRRFTKEEQEAISVRTLEGGNTAYLWPLSKAEAEELPYDMMVGENNSSYWTRSPKDDDEVYYVSPPYSILSDPVSNNTGYGIRPAVNLKLSSILFCTDIEQQRQTGEVGDDVFIPIEYSRSTKWILTIKDSARKNFKAETTAITDGKYDISYSGALTGEHEYISAVIVDSKGNIKYCAIIKELSNKADAAGTISINTKDKLVPGDTLYVFNEQTQIKKTNYASELNDVTKIKEKEEPKKEVTPEKKETTPKAKKAPSGVLLARMDKQGKNGVKLTWTKLPKAKGYDIYFAHCDTNEQTYDYKKVKTINNNKTFTWKKAGLRKYHCYKAYVRAWVKKDNKKKYIKSSPTVHAFITGPKGKFTNPKRVYVTKTVITLKKGKSEKMNARVAKPRKGLQYLSHRHTVKLRYVSADPKVARVSKTGKITAKGVGKCKVYALAVNGARKAVTVKVK